MRREGSALAGAGTVMMKELGDNLSSTRMRLLELLVFLRIFTTAKGETLPSFAAFLGFLIPIVAIALGFDSVNSEFNGKTMSRILAQPIYRDALLFGKFMAGLTTLAVMLCALWIFVIGLAILMLGLPPGGEEVMRGLAFLIASIAYGGAWLALAMLFSVMFRSAATAALASLAVWLLFAFFWNMVITVITPIIAPVDPYNPMSILYTVEVGQALSRLSPNTLFAETTMAFLNPGTRSLGLVLQSQMQGAISGPLPFTESMALVWPQVTGLLASVIGLFTVAYVMFQRQEVRA